MIVIDKLCYRSRLRYVNASEKFLYTVATLVICVAGRSPAAAAAAFAVNGILTVRKGGIPLSRYIRLLMVPLAFQRRLWTPLRFRSETGILPEAEIL